MTLVAISTNEIRVAVMESITIACRPITATYTGFDFTFAENIKVYS